MASQAPDPDNILWENIYTGKLDRFIRRFLSVGVTILLLVGTFLLIAYTREQQKQVQSKYPKVSCQALDEVTKEKAILEYQLKSEDEFYVQVGYIECYCKGKINEIFNDRLESDVSKIC